MELLMDGFFKMDFIVDTATDWLMVEGIECDSCDGNRYDPKEAVELTSFLSERRYGSNTFIGKEIRANLCYLFTDCTDIDCFYIMDQVG